MLSTHIVLLKFNIPALFFVQSTGQLNEVIMDDEFFGLTGFEGFGIRSRQYFSEKRKNRKTLLTRYNIVMMLRRTLQMFDWKIEWRGETCKTIDKRNLELLVQSTGLAGLVEIDGNIYALFGTMGGQPNWNYMPTKFIFVNAYLNQSGERNIYDLKDGGKKNCVIIPNDSMYQGMIPVLSYHSELITEIELTKKAVLVWARAPHTFTAPTSNGVEDIKSYLKDLEKGNLSAIYDRNMLKDMKDLGSDTSISRGSVTQILEALQYEKASLFNDIGLEMNYNMKRETITSSEAQLGEGSLKPLPDDMMDMRKIACKEANELWGGDLNIEVEFASSWRDLHTSIELDLRKKEAETEENEDVQSTGQINEEVNEDGQNDNGMSGGDGQQSEPDNINGADTRESESADNNDGTAEEVIAEVAGKLDMASQQLEELIEEDVQSTGQGEEDETSDKTS